MVVGTIAKRLRPLKSPLSSSVCALCATPHTTAAAFAFHVAFTVLVFVCPQYVRPSVRPRRRRRRRGPSTFLLSPSRRTRGGGSAAVTKHNLTSDIDLVEAGKAVALHMCSIRCQRQCQQPLLDCKWPIRQNDEVTSKCRSRSSRGDDTLTTITSTATKNNIIVIIGTARTSSPWTPIIIIALVGKNEIQQWRWLNDQFR